MRTELSCCTHPFEPIPIRPGLLYVGNILPLLSNRKNLFVVSFGMQMPGRKGLLSGADYRYAFNGMEIDIEVSGVGNSYTTEFRQYDPRLGRWKSRDPLAGQFPWQSPYAAFDNDPVFYNDPLGLSTSQSSDPQTDDSDGEGEGTETSPYRVNSIDDGRNILDGKMGQGLVDDVFFTVGGGTTFRAEYNQAMGTWKLYQGDVKTDLTHGDPIPKSQIPSFKPRQYFGTVDPVFKKFLPELFDTEGGFVDDLDDPGGATNMGITIGKWERKAKEAIGVEGTLENLKNLTENQAALFYQKEYWEPIYAGEIEDEQVAFQYVDTYINGGGLEVMRKALTKMGVPNAMSMSRKELVEAINSVDPEELFNNFREERIARYKRLIKENPTLIKYKNGWLNRANSFQYEK